MTHRKLILTLSVPIVFIVLLGGFIVAYEMRQPPLDRLQQALDSVESARTARAEQWAGDDMQKARRHLGAAQQAIRDVSSGWWPFESYHIADSLLTESIRLSQLAAARARERLATTRDGISSDVIASRDSLGIWRSVLDSDLPRAEDESLHRAASFSVQMAEALLEKGQHEAAREYADSARVLFQTLEDKYHQHAASSRQWVRKSQEWISRTLDESRTSGKTALIVDKTKHRLFVVTGGRIVDSTDCELGFNSGHQKRISGDGATPEGMYRVTRVNGRSKYYRALLLNYPNEDDRKRFKYNLEAGVIRADSKMGSLIEIHGHGGQGRDWTDGCVAVSDRTMDMLVKVAPEGTAVTVVRAWENR
ncbi:MAG: L,D-transpeptidase family protein [candidate division Zixibacteria bacterium]|nr:L,D-transpeptidase family protein [candidate division Zixibacteria bacterium]